MTEVCTWNASGIFLSIVPVNFVTGHCVSFLPLGAPRLHSMPSLIRIESRNLMYHCIVAREWRNCTVQQYNDSSSNNKLADFTRIRSDPPLVANRRCWTTLYSGLMSRVLVSPIRRWTSYHSTVQDLHCMTKHSQRAILSCWSRSWRVCLWFRLLAAQYMHSLDPSPKRRRRTTISPRVRYMCCGRVYCVR